MKKVSLIFFFIVVFGLPITWYFFLQAFGENRFDLPLLSEWNTTCVEISPRPYLFIDKSKVISAPNEKRRIALKLEKIPEIELMEIHMDSCATSSEMYFVDNKGWIRGEYMLSREEVDRLMAEMDIYILNFRNESGTGQK